jgi:putative DNA primase/helicase
MFGARGVDRLSSTEIVDVLGKMEDRPWPEWKNGKPITPRQLAKLLDAFGIVPVSIKLGTGATPKGYHLRSFREALRRYPPSQSATPPHPLETDGFGSSQSATNEDKVADTAAKKSQKPNGGGEVADTEPPRRKECPSCDGEGCPWCKPERPPRPSLE